MQSKKMRMYLYPITKVTFREGGNDYIPNLASHLSKHFTIVNKQTSLGLLDVVLKLFRCDVLYFNWIEDVADKKFGGLQVALLHGIVRLCKLARIKIVWFIHNNLSHKKENRALKQRVVALMQKNADVILSHSAEADNSELKQRGFVFHHPVADYHSLNITGAYAYDLLIWGTVNPYKGVEEFLKFNQQNAALQQYKILIAGRFSSQPYFETVAQLKGPNVTLENKLLSEAELITLFSKCRQVLFTYNATSVLSSAALCKTLVYGKTIIGPAAGSFKELGANGLIYTYHSFAELVTLLPGLPPRETDVVYQDKLKKYIAQNSWEDFALFVKEHVQPQKPLLQAAQAL